MPGRGDNNKHGSAGHGVSNQSNQPFIAADEKHAKSNHDKQHTGGEPSMPQEKTTDANRNAATATEKIKPLRTGERTFNLLIDDVPYIVKVSPFRFNGETRFYVSVNGGDDHVFTWDSELSGMRAIDDNAAILPPAVEEAISQKLQSQQK